MRAIPGLILIILCACAQPETKPEPPPQAAPAFSQNQAAELTVPDVVCHNVSMCSRLIQGKIKIYWHQPSNTDHLKTTVKIDLDKEFKLVSASVLNPTGNRDFDLSVKQAIRKASPFKELKGLSSEDAKAFKSIVFEFKPGKHRR